MRAELDQQMQERDLVKQREQEIAQQEDERFVRFQIALPFVLLLRTEYSTAAAAATAARLLPCHLLAQLHAYAGMQCCLPQVAHVHGHTRPAAVSAEGERGAPSE